MVLSLCDRWSCPPSVIYAEPAERLLRLLSIERLGTPQVEMPIEGLPPGYAEPPYDQ